MVHREQCVDFALQEPDVCVCVGAAGGRRQPHIRTTIPTSVQYRATDHFRQQLRPHLYEQGHQGV